MHIEHPTFNVQPAPESHPTLDVGSSTLDIGSLKAC